MDAVRDFPSGYGLAFQVALTAALIWGLGAWAGRGRAQGRDGWRHASFGWAMQAITVLIVAALTTALLRNGRALFEESRIVVAVIFVATLGFWWMFYEVFITRLRWNDDRMEVHRPPLPRRTIRFGQLQRVTHHPVTESLTFAGADGTRIWIPYSYRTGMGDLLARLCARPAAEDSA